MASRFIRNEQSIRLSFEKIIKNSKHKDNFNVMPGDKINILTKPNFVQVIGEVNNPGFFQYYEGSSLKNYIDISGGLTINAEHKEIWVTYPDGTSRQLKIFRPDPKIYDGSVITVGIKEETEPVDKTEFAKELASIVSDFLQIALTFILIVNNNI